MCRVKAVNDVAINAWKRNTPKQNGPQVHAQSERPIPIFCVCMTGGGFLLLLAINWHAPDYQISRKWKRDVSFIIEIEKIKLYAILFKSHFVMLFLTIKSILIFKRNSYYIKTK